MINVTRSHWLSFPSMALLLLAGCIESQTTITVNRDGSGQIIETTVMSRAMQDMMNRMTQFAAGQGAIAGAEPTIESAEFVLPVNEAEYQKRAAAMGPGIGYDSYKRVETEDGRSGVTVVYRFTDIRALKYRPGADPQTRGTAPAATTRTPITFELSRDSGSTNRLVVHLPPFGDSQSSPDTVESAAGGGEQATVDQSEPKMNEQAKEMLKDFRFSLKVAVDGEIVNTNSTYWDRDAGLQPQTVTLYDLNFRELTENETAWNEFIAAGSLENLKDYQAGIALLTKFPGIAIESARRVEIGFR